MKALVPALSVKKSRVPPGGSPMLKVVALIVLDHLIIFSCTFLVLYCAMLLLASFIPAKWKIAPSSLGIPLVAVLSAALMATPWEPFLTATLRWLTVPVFSASHKKFIMGHSASVMRPFLLMVLKYHD